MTKPELTDAYKTVLGAMGVEYMSPDFPIDANFVLGPVMEWLREHGYGFSMGHGDEFWVSVWPLNGGKTPPLGYADAAHDAIMFAAAAALEEKQ